MIEDRGSRVGGAGATAGRRVVDFTAFAIARVIRPLGDFVASVRAARAALR